VYEQGGVPPYPKRGSVLGRAAPAVSDRPTRTPPATPSTRIWDPSILRDRNAQSRVARAIRSEEETAPWRDTERTGSGLQDGGIKVGWAPSVLVSTLGEHAGDLHSRPHTATGSRFTVFVQVIRYLS
jgi:hypothetical protein